MAGGVWPDDLSIVVERHLPAERSHNGLLSLSDGSLITKDLRLIGQGDTTISRLDAETLELIGDPLVLPEGSMGRIAADVDEDGNDLVYVPGTEHIWCLRPDGDTITVDDWRPRYRNPDDPWGLSWDACLSDGACWIMDCGDIESVRLIHTTEPNGRFAQAPGRGLSWQHPSPRSGAQRLLRLDLADDTSIRSIEPFGRPGGGIVAPPMHVPDLDRAIAWDSINGGLAGIATDGDELSVAWTLDARPTMQPIVFADGGELVTNDFTAGGSDDLIVVDVATGELLDRVATGSRLANGMFLSPGDGRSVFYCTTTIVAKVEWL